MENTSRSKASVDELIRRISLPSVSSLSDMSSLSFPSSSDNSDPDPLFMDEFTDALATIGESVENDFTRVESESSINVEGESAESSISESEVEQVIPKLKIETPIIEEIPIKTRKYGHEDLSAAIGGLSFWPAYLALLKKKGKLPRKSSKENKFNKILSDEIPYNVNKIFSSLDENKAMNDTFNDRLNEMIRDEFYNISLNNQTKSKFVKSKNGTDKVEIRYPQTKLRSISLQFDPNEYKKHSIKVNGNGYSKIKKSHVYDSNNSVSSHVNVNKDDDKSVIEMDLIKVLTKLIKEYKIKLNKSKKDVIKKQLDRSDRQKCSIESDKYDVFDLTDRSVNDVSNKSKVSQKKNSRIVPQTIPFSVKDPSFEPYLLEANPSNLLQLTNRLGGYEDEVFLKGLVNSGVKYHVIELANVPLLPKSLLEALRLTNNSTKLYLDTEPYGDSGFGRVKLSANVGIYKISLLSDNVDHINIQNLNIDNWRITTTEVLDKSFNEIGKNTGNDWLSRNYGFNYMGVKDLLNDDKGCVKSLDSVSSNGNNCVMVSIQYRDSLSRSYGQIGLIDNNKSLPNSILTVLPNRKGDCHDFITVPQVRVADSSNNAVRNQMVKHGLIFELAQKLSKDNDNKSNIDFSETFIHLVHPETKQYLCLNRLTGHIQFRKINFTNFNFTHSPRSGKRVEWIPACFKLLPLYKYTPSAATPNVNFIDSVKFNMNSDDLSSYVSDYSRNMRERMVTKSESKSNLPKFNRIDRDFGKSLKPKQFTYNNMGLVSPSAKQDVVINSTSVELAPKGNTCEEIGNFTVESPKNGNAVDVTQQCVNSANEISDLQFDSDDEAKTRSSGCCSYDMFGSNKLSRPKSDVDTSIVISNEKFFHERSSTNDFSTKDAATNENFSSLNASNEKAATNENVATNVEKNEKNTSKANRDGRKGNVVNVTLRDIDDLREFVNIISPKSGCSGRSSLNSGDGKPNYTNNARFKNRNNKCIEDGSSATGESNLADSCIASSFPIKGTADITISKLDISNGGKKISGDCGVKFFFSGDNALPTLKKLVKSHK